ncbi:C39 family peptidase [bacterium]|nr:C39 family peptidase [bacterium]
MSSTTTLIEQEATRLLRGLSLGVTLDAKQAVLRDGEIRGSLESPLTSAEAPFDRACVSVNAETPGDSVVEVSLEVSLDDRSRTRWLPLGLLGASDAARKVPRSASSPTTGPARVAIDTVELEPGHTRDPCGRALRVRLGFLRSSFGESPRVSRVALVAWPRGARDPETSGTHEAWGRVLSVPERSQQVEDAKVAEKICSPTALAMVLAFHGKARETSEVCREVYDHASGIYGNWSLNVAYAGRLGLDAKIARMGSFSPLEAEIAAGRPVVISHRWRQGELEGAPLAVSQGHLVVVRGFTRDGDLVVNDPCADPRRRESIERVYRRRDIERTWLENADGIAYIVRRVR